MHSRVISSLLLRSSSRVLSVRISSLPFCSNANRKELDDNFNGFVNDIKISRGIALKNHESDKDAINQNDLINLLSKPTLTYDETILALRSAESDSSKQEVSAICERDKHCFVFSDELKNPDHCLALLTCLITSGLCNSKLYNNVIDEMKDLNQFAASIGPINKFLLACRRYEVSVEKVEVVLSKMLKSAVRGIEKPSELLAAVHNFNGTGAWFDTVVEKTKDLLPIMNLSEIVSIFRGFGARTRREQLLFKVMAQRIAESRESLTVNQMVLLSSSCAKVHFFDARIMRKIATDLRNAVNHLDNWGDVSSLVDSFSRLNLGNCAIWETLTAWVTGHLDTASVRDVSIVVSGMARMNIKGGKPAAEWLCKNLRREAARSPFVWLSAVHSLAFYEVISQQLAETVLNRDFVAELMRADITNRTKTYHAQKILQVQGIIDILYGENYKGARVNKTQFGNIFSEENINNLRLAKYRKDTIKGDAEIKLFDNGLWKLAPKTHIGPSLVDQCGTYCDASIIVDKDNRLVAFSQWGDSVPRPLIFVSFLDTAKSMDLNDALDESILAGSMSISLRLLDRSGSKPIAIYEQKLAQCSSLEDKLKYIKSKIVE